MDNYTTEIIGKTAIELAQNEHVVKMVNSTMGMLAPYAGITRKAVDVYIESISESDLPAETKALFILHTRSIFKKLKNQKDIVDIALNNAKHGVDFTEKSGVREEWLDRYMDSAGFVSSEEMQIVWGKILAREFENPGTTPPNMIRILSEITSELAKAFRTLCSMSIYIIELDENGNCHGGGRHTFVPFGNKDESFRKMGASFEMLNELEAIGLIRFDTLAGYIEESIASDKCYIIVNNAIYMAAEYEKNSFPIGNVIFTEAGKALRDITEVIRVDRYSDMVCDYLRRKGLKLEEQKEYIIEENEEEILIKRKDLA